MRNWIFFFLLFSAKVFAHSPLATTESEPSAIIGGCFNAITGEIVIQQNDVIVAGVEPIRLPRIYLSSDRQNSSLGWHFTSELFAYTTDMIPDPDASEEWEAQYHLQIVERNGTVLEFKRGENSSRHDRKNPDLRFRYHFISSQHERGWTNTNSGSLSSQNNPKNYSVFLNETESQIHCFCPDGSRRVYQKISQSLNYSNGTHEHRVYALHKERLPNGNFILYHYDKNGRLEGIETKNPSETKSYTWARFHYLGKPEESRDVDIHTSDGRILSYRYQREAEENKKHKHKKKHTTPHFFLTEVAGSGIPPEHIEYLPLTTRPPRILHKKILPQGRVLALDVYHKGNNYIGDALAIVGSESDPRYERVKEVFAPVGKDTHLYQTMRVFYNTDQHFTEIYDLNNNLTIYHSDSDERLKKIERFQKEQNGYKLYHKETFAWGEKGSPFDGFLICKSLLNPDGTALRAVRYLYDTFGNVLEENTYGNLSGECPYPLLIDSTNMPVENWVERATTLRTYSQDDHHLLLSEQFPNGLTKRFHYLSGTRLISKEFLCDGQRIIQRRFCFYNHDNILDHEAIDDGFTEDYNNLSGVTERTIRAIKPYEHGPYYGLPQEIDERYLDLATLQEKLITKTRLHYCRGNKVASKKIYDANGQFRYRIEMDYDDAGNLKRETNPLGQVSTFDYDANHNRIRYLEPSGRVSHTYAYDYVNRLIEEKIETAEGLVHDHVFQYNLCDQKEAEYDHFGNRTSYAYDGFGKLLTTTFPKSLDAEGQPYHPSVIREVDSEGRPRKEIDPKGNVEETSYNARGQPIRIHHADGTIETFTYSIEGLLIRRTDTAGTAFYYTYDLLDRETSCKVVSPEGNILQETRKEYNTFHLIRSFDVNGYVTEYFYDGAGRIIREEFHNGPILECTYYSYDPLGNLYSIRKGDEVQIYERDLLGRIIEERIENDKGEVQRKTATFYNSAGDVERIHRWIDGQEIIESFSYDDFHRLAAHINPFGQRTEYLYDEQAKDAFGQRVLKKTTIDPLGIQTIETFDALGRLTHLLKLDPEQIPLDEETLLYDRNGNLARKVHSVIIEGKTQRQRELVLDYDERNRLKRFIDESRITEHTYTLTGQLNTTIKPDGVCIHRFYDPLDRLIEITTSDGSCHYGYTYDGQGNLLSTVDLIRNQEINRTLDGRGRLLGEYFPCGVNISWTYDAQGKRSSFTFPDRSSIRYHFNGCNLTSIERRDSEGGQSYIHEFLRFDLSGNVLEEQAIDGHSSLVHHFDPLNRHSYVGSKWMEQGITSYDSRSLIRSIEWKGALGSYAEGFDYDPLKQLIEEKSLTSHRYQYDSQGNRIMKNNHEMEIDEQNQLLNDGQNTYTYDANGNLISSQGVGGACIYTCDGLDRLSSIQTSEKKIQFTYDGLHRRLSKTISSATSQEICFYLYDNTAEIGSMNASGEIQELRILGRTPKAETGAAVAIEIHGSTYIPLHDLRGSIVALINPRTDAIEETYHYNSFGEEEIHDSSHNLLSSSSLGNPWRFASKRIDEETHLVFFGRRYYIPELGRWLTPDPQGYTDGPNLYSFLLNNPLSCFDLYGLTALADKDELDLIDHMRSGIRNVFEALPSAAKETGTFVGDTVNTVTHHLPYIPLITEGLHQIGNLISKNQYKPNKSQVISVGKERIPGFNKFQVNGMLNSLEDALKSLKKISDENGGIYVEGFYRATHGFCNDLIICGLAMLGCDITGDGKQLAEITKDRLSRGEDLDLSGHSAGNLVIDLAKCYLTNEEMSHINLTSFGSPISLRDKRWGNYSNYVSKRDPICMLSLSYYTGKCIKLEAHKLIEHSIACQTYMEQMKRTIERRLNEIQKK